MPLQAGDRLGPYEVIHPLGAGAMGEVYRARDLRLKRDVALKVLPDEFRSDPRRVARLEREARALAAVNHPNIAVLYGIEEGRGLHALVMELVEGETLSDRLAIARRTRSGGLPVGEALAIARQVADALEAAHERGIVHRDLKPDNIKVRDDGAVKVLDFGLAHGSEAETTADALPSTATASHVWGPAAGTPAYMSPEQARGAPVDHRSDVWAFGCVLYEMLTGRRPFEGETASDVLARVIEREPALDSLPLETPPSIRRLLRRTLAKDPHQRLHDIADARLELLETDSPPAAQPAATSAGLRRAAAVAALLVVAGAAWTSLRGTPTTPVRVSRFEIAPPASAPLRDGGDETRLFALSPDGAHLAYLTTRGLAIRRLDSLDVEVLEGANIGNFPFFSPDGKWVGGTLDGLSKVSVSGGPVARLADAAPGAIGAWGDDGIVFADVNGLFRVSADGGTPEPLPLKLAPNEQATFPEPIPGRRAVLVTIIPTRSNTLGDAASSSAARIESLDLDTGVRRVVIRGGGRPRYLPSGHVIYASDQSLFVVPFDKQSLSLTGEPLPLGEGSAEYAVSNEGTLLYGVGLGVPSRQLVWVDRRGVEQPLGAPPAGYAYPRLSPDGTRIALDVPGPNRDIWIWDIRRRVLERFTTDPTENVLPAWSPDGKYLAFTGGLSGVPNMFLQAANGSGSAELLLKSPLLNQVVSFAPDGRLIFTESVPGRGRDIKALRLDNKSVETLVDGAGEQLSPEVSPDGRWLAYMSDESGQLEIYVRPCDLPASGRWKVSVNGGRSPLWSRDGRELFYRDFGGALLSVPIAAGRAFSPGPAVTLIPPGRKYVGFGSAVGARTYDVSPDGSRFLMIKNLDEGREPSLVVVQNWLTQVSERLRAR